MWDVIVQPDQQLYGKANTKVCKSGHPDIKPPNEKTRYAAQEHGIDKPWKEGGMREWTTQPNHTNLLGVNSGGNKMLCILAMTVDTNSRLLVGQAIKKNAEPTWSKPESNGRVLHIHEILH
jgi:hypothetical protein